jgi:hypothetical protein
MRLVPGRRACADDDKPAFPFEALAAVAAYVADPVAIIDFAQCGQDLGSCLPTCTDDAGKILDGEDAMFADLSE